ncbi:hypothetical protein NBRC116602_08360 [Hyphomicrobiales bacterium 4NK60-0047b]
MPGRHPENAFVSSQASFLTIARPHVMQDVFANKVSLLKKSVSTKKMRLSHSNKQSGLIKFVIV